MREPPAFRPSVLQGEQGKLRGLDPSPSVRLPAAPVPMGFACPSADRPRFAAAAANEPPDEPA